MIDPATVTQEQAAPPTQTLAEKISAATLDNYKDLLLDILKVDDSVIKEAHLAALAKKISVPKQILSDALEEMDREINGEIKAVFPELIDLVRTDDNKIAYLVLKDGVPAILDQWKTADGQTFVPPEENLIPFKVGAATKVMEHYHHDNDRAVVVDTFAYLKRFSYLPDAEWVVIAMSVLLSYLQSHPEVRYIPVIYFYAVAERGKSRTAKSMLSIMYRGTHLIDFRIANILRYADRFNASMFFDCTDIWRTAGKGDGEDFLLGRFEKGTSVVRVLHPEKGPFRDQVKFEVFGSTIVATNEPANTTFESRCLMITMPNKPGDYEDSTPEGGVALKERLIAFRARNMTRTLPKVEKNQEITGRLRDISRPLFQMCSLFYPEGTEPMKNLLIEMVGKKVEVKKGTLEGKIIKAISEIVNFDGVSEVTFRFDEITKRVNFGIPELQKYSTQKLGRVVESLSIKTKTIQGYSHVTIGQHELEELEMQYGLAIKDSSKGLEPGASNLKPAANPLVKFGIELEPTSATKVENACEILQTTVPLTASTMSEPQKKRAPVAWASQISRV